MEVKKNDIFTVKITDTGTDGEGIGRVSGPGGEEPCTAGAAPADRAGTAGGFTLFIKDAVIGDTVQAKVMKAKKHYAYAKLEKVIEPSPFRVTPLCPFSRQCGGCQLQALSYDPPAAQR